MSEFKIMFIADICGKAGRQAAAHMVKPLREKFNVDYVICNVENAAGGFGGTPEMSKKIFSYGVDMQTSGNHIWDRQEIIKYFYTKPKLIRPGNYPEGAPGTGAIIDEINGVKVGVMNLMGRTYMRDLDCPFRKADEEVARLREETNIIFLDMHAEATSEKQAMFYHLDGMITALVGTHTHVQTADEKVSKRGTAYISDAGMTGAYESVIGMNIKPSVDRFIRGLPIRFTPATEDVRISGVVITLNPETGEALHIERYCEKFDINNPPKNAPKEVDIDEGKL